MAISDTAMMKLGITQSTNIHNTRSLIRTLKYVLDILQTEEAFKVEEYKKTHTHTILNFFQKSGAHVRPSCGSAESSNIFTSKPPWQRHFSTKGLKFISAISLKRTPPVPNR